MYLKYSKIRDVISPTRGHPTDAGLDFYMPKFNEQFRIDFMDKNRKLFFSMLNGSERIFLPPGKNALIPSGIKVEIPYGYMGLFLNKSGVASKKKLLIGSCCADTFYSGEIHIDLHNVGDEEVVLFEDEKLVQMVLTPAFNFDVILVEETKLYDWMKMGDLRGEKGFGSTN